MNFHLDTYLAKSSTPKKRGNACTNSVYYPNFVKMEQYLSVVKPGRANLEEIEKQGIFQVKKWPSFLGAAVERGKDYWEKFIHRDNYFLTSVYYASDDYAPYCEWLMSDGRFFYEELVSEIAMFSSRPEITREWNYLYRCTKDDKMFLGRVLQADNVAVVSSYADDEKLNFAETLVLLKKAINARATKCTDLVIDQFRSFESRSMGTAVWYFLIRSMNHSVVISLERFLKVTRVSEKEKDGDNLKIAFLGTAKEVKVLVEEEKIKFDSAIPHVLMTRIPYDEKFADVLLEYANARKYFCKAKLAASVMGHNRPPGHTEIIIRAMNKRGIVFTHGEWTLNLDCAVVQALEALFSVRACFVRKVHFQFSFKFGTNLVKENKFKEFKKVLIFMLPYLTPENLVTLFSCIPAHLCQWTYRLGHFSNLHDPLETLKLAVDRGNALLAAIALKELEKSDADGNEFKEQVLCVQREQNSEAHHLLQCWVGATEEQKEIFLKEPFGTNYCDISRKKSVHATGGGGGNFG